MEFHGKKSFWTSPEPVPTQRGFHSPSHSDALTLSPSPRRPSSASPWQLLSPPRRTAPPPPPSPSLHYHCLASLHRQDGDVHAIALAARSRLLFTCSDSDRVRAWRRPDLADGGLLRTRRPRVRALLAHGDALFTAHADRRVRAWAVAAAVAPASSGVRWRKVATFPPRRLRLSFFRRRQERIQQQQHREEISCLALYAAGKLLYTGSWDRTVKAWRVGDGRCVDSFAAHDGRVNAVVVAQDDGGVFTAGGDGCVKVWRRVYGESTHALTMVLRFQASPVNALAAGGGGGAGYVYSGSSDGYVNIWEREAVTGRYRHAGFLQGHSYAVLCLAAVERLILSGSEDTTIRVWRREEGSSFHVCLAVIEGHRGPVQCIAVAVEMEMIREGGMGLLVYSASLDRVLKAWRLKVAAENQEKERGKKEEEEDEEDDEDERWWPPLRLEGEEYGMTPVLSPLWVEKRLRETHLY